MVAQPGKNVFVKIGTLVSSVVVAALRTATLSIANQMVDVSNRDSASQWRELLAGAGIVNASVSGDGIVTDNAQMTDLLSKCSAQSLDDYVVSFSNGDTLSGKFQLTKIEFKGNFNGEQTYSFTLESGGALTLTAAA